MRTTRREGVNLGGPTSNFVLRDSVGTQFKTLAVGNARGDGTTYISANPTTHTTEELIPCSTRARHMSQ